MTPPKRTVSNRPVFGVMTTAIPKKHDQRSHNGRYQPKHAWRQIEQAGHECGLLTCLFCPDDVDVARQQVNGWVCLRDQAGRESWRRMLCPLPDVVYDNVYVHLSARPDVKRARRLLQHAGVPLFNPTLGDKAELADWLRTYTSLWAHHPDTIRLRRSSDVRAWLKRYPAIYLKPVLGSAGAGILEIRPLDACGDQYRVQAAKYGPKKQPLDRTMSGPTLERFLQKLTRRSTYILQAGCDLLHVDGCKIDLRTHLQRNRSGQWECIALIVKQGRKHSIVSNYHAGGATHEWSWLVQQARKQQVELPTKQELEQLSIAIATAYARKAPLLGSLGLDLGIDTEGEVWLLDVNSRPGRNILDAEGKDRCQVKNAEFAAWVIEQRN